MRVETSHRIISTAAGRMSLHDNTTGTTIGEAIRQDGEWLISDPDGTDSLTAPDARAAIDAMVEHAERVLGHGVSVAWHNDLLGA